MTSISLLCPTRSRPALFKRLCDSIIQHSADLTSVELIAYIDEDDTESHSIEFQGIPGEKIIRPQAPMSLCNKACLNEASGDIIILMNDDLIIRTPGWDNLLREAASQFQDEIYLMYPNDLFKKQKLGTLPVFSRKVCDVLVEPFTTQYQGNFIDTHLFDIFQRLIKQGVHRVRYLKHIVFEHMHYRLGKGIFDATYQARRRFADDLCFVQLSDQRESAAKRLLEAIENKPLSPLDQQEKPIPFTTFWGAIKHYFSIFAMNKRLPLRWRTWLFTHFLARYWAGKWF